MLKYGTETLVKDYDKDNIVKTPLARIASKRKSWLVGQQVAADTGRQLSQMSDGAYIIPQTKLIDNENFRVIEERVNGVPLTPILFKSLDDTARASIVNSLARFYADIHKTHPVDNKIAYKMHYEFAPDGLSDFVKKDMRKWFPMADVRLVERVCRYLPSVEYETRLVWAHNDLFSENVLYDAHTNKCAIIDFTKAGYNFLHHDIIDSYANDLGVFNDFRAQYLKYCNMDNLPDTFTDSEKWNTILNYHRSADAVLDMIDNISGLSVDTNYAIAQMRADVASLHRTWSR